MGKALIPSGKQAERQSVRLAFSLCAIVALHYAFSIMDWYVAWSSLDWLMHGACGAWAAAFCADFFFVRGRAHASHPACEAVIVVGLAVLVGVLWEMHEFVLDLFITDPTRILQPSLADTMGDLFFDLLGASMTLTVRSARFPWNSHSS